MGTHGEHQVVITGDTGVSTGSVFLGTHPRILARMNAVHMGKIERLRTLLGQAIDGLDLLSQIGTRFSDHAEALRDMRDQLAGTQSNEHDFLLQQTRIGEYMTDLDADLKEFQRLCSIRAEPHPGAS